jgi:predicted nucleic acid-binding protein
MPLRPVAVLDAAVLVPPGVRDVLLSLADGGAFRPVWQSEIEAELRRNAIRLARATARPAEQPTAGVEQAVDRTLALMNEAFPDARADSKLWLPLVPRMLNHPKDRHVLAAAVGVKATHLVTANTKDFPKRSLPAGLVITRPGAFAVELLSSDPATVLYGLERMVARHQRPPKSLRELAKLLSAGQQMPDFGRALAELL